MVGEQSRLDDAGQSELLARYCQEAERLLADAPTYESALKLRDDLCARFRQECQSSLIVNATHEYLTQIIGRTWQQSHDRDH